MKIKLCKTYKDFDTKENQKFELELHFKKIFSIIFQYHKNNKTIIFLDSPYKFKTKQHLFLSSSQWMPGLLTNKQYIYKNSNFPRNFLNNSPDLFVVFNSKIHNNLLKETLKLKIPVFMLGHSTFKLDTIKYNRFILFLFHNIFKIK